MKKTAGKSDPLQNLRVAVWREHGGPGEYQHFTVPARDNQTVLDVVSYIQNHLDSTLSYRFACRVGMCGSCAMMVNGEPRWTCRSHVKKIHADHSILTIAPLRNLPIIKDLVTDMDVFFDKWIKAEGVHHPSRTRHDPIQKIDQRSEQRRTANQAIECINCAVCYAACDVVSANADYLGPAALNRAWSLLNDVKDAGHELILEAVSQADGCHNCHSHQSCMKYCPNELNPTASIAGLKRQSAKYQLKKIFTKRVAK